MITSRSIFGSSFAALVLFAVVASGAEAPRRVVALEWVPLKAHEDVLAAFQRATAAYGIPIAVQQISALGDEAELKGVLGQMKTHPPDLLLAMGDRVFKEVSVELPEVPILGFFCRDTSVQRPARGDVVISDPPPDLVWRAAEELRPGARHMAILFTAGYAPNEHLAAALDALKPVGGSLKTITVPAGACRDDSDYEKALRELKTEPPTEVLFVPEDANSGRFGRVICEAAAKQGVPVMATESLIGKGCATALVMDKVTLGQWAARKAKALWEGRDEADVPLPILHRATKSAPR